MMRRIVGYLDGVAGQVAALARLRRGLEEQLAAIEALPAALLRRAFSGEL